VNSREMKKMILKSLQEGGMNRHDARRVVYGPTWKMSTRPGMGVQRAIPRDTSTEYEDD
jgi:hypothetical protein